MHNKRMTVVFEIVDPDALKKIYESHIRNELICGAIPTIIASGDQVSIPGDILSALSCMDPDAIDEKLLRELISQSEEHLARDFQVVV